MRKIMNLQKLRMDRGWSQEQLAELSGISARTIQRIENGHNAGLDTLNSLAAAFDTDVATLTASRGENGSSMRGAVDAGAFDDIEELRDIRQVQRTREFYLHLVTFGLIIPILLILNLTLSPSYLWVIWPFLGWGAGVILHWVMVFRMPGFLDHDLEEKRMSQRMNGSG